MFCPKCATENLDGASFCRKCGANVSLVQNALAGQLPEEPSRDCDGLSLRRRGRREPGLEHAFKNAFMGLAFLLVAIALAAAKQGWWFWMLIPAFSMMGTGVAQFIRIKDREKRTFQARNFMQPEIQPPSNVNTFSARQTGELVAPPASVTEGTTRHLGAEAPTRHFGASSDVTK